MNVATQEQVLLGWMFVVIYMATILFFVIRGALKTNSMDDYALGNMQFTPLFVALSFAAATTSAATFIINPGFIAIYGLSAFLSIGIAYPLTAILSFIILSKGFRKFGASVKAETLAQWIGKKYDSKFLQTFFSILSFLLVTFIVLILVGLSQVFSKLLNVDVIYVLTFVVIFIFGYMMFGGANSMVYTNTIQAFLMIITAIFMLSSGLDYFMEGNFWNKLNEIDPLLLQTKNPNSPLFRDYVEIFLFQFIIGIAIICQPHILTKALLLKSDRHVNKYLFYGVIVQTLFFLVVFTGFYARLLFPDLTFQGQKLKMDEIIPTYIVVKFNVYVTILLVLGVISAGISTIEGLIQSLSTTITVDLIKNAILKGKETNYLLVNKIVIVIIGVVSWFLAYDQIINPKLSVAIFAQSGVYAFFAVSFIPLFFGMFLKDVNKNTILITSIITLLLYFWIFYTGKFPYISRYLLDENGNVLPIINPAIPAAVSIVFSILLGAILHYIFSKNKKNS